MGYVIAFSMIFICIYVIRKFKNKYIKVIFSMISSIFLTAILINIYFIWRKWDILQFRFIMQSILTGKIIIFDFIKWLNNGLFLAIIFVHNTFLIYYISNFKLNRN